MSVLCLHVVQAAVVYTLMIQDVLRDPEWSAALALAGLPGADPAVLGARRMHGEFKLNMSTRPTLDSATSAV